MDWHTWLAFFVASWIIAVSPGSGAVLSMSHGLSYGVRKTSATILGLQLGLLLILLIAGAGVGSLLMASEIAFNVVKIVGAAYLIYLGISQWRAGGSALATQESMPQISFQKRVLTGFLTNATNPKGIIFMVAVLPQFMSSNRPLAPQLAILAVTMLAVDTVVMHSYAAGASALRSLMRSARAMRNQNRVFGSLLVAVGTGLFFVQRANQ
ncbi:LysE family transporter [Comamonas sp. lk]|uniref:LysE family transporter n=1 Tax=Comamonas sp. lk TaxID=2201272 RepID=UPI000EABBE9F|nr:LysE family transporter [Comamonas sp. lk]